MGVRERKAREFKRREEEILETAYDLLTGMEPMQMTMELIAERTEIGRGTIYKHFKSKDEIFAHLIVRRRAKIIESLIEIEREGIEKVPRLIRSYMDYCLSDPTAYAVHKSCENHCLKSNLSEELIETLDNQQEQKIGLVEAILRAALGASSVDSSSISFICAGWGMLRGAIDAMMDDRFSGTMLDKDEYYSVVERMLLSGIAAAFP